jgi:hypothetical protein
MQQVTTATLPIFLLRFGSILINHTNPSMAAKQLIIEVARQIVRIHCTISDLPNSYILRIFKRTLRITPVCVGVRASHATLRYIRSNRPMRPLPTTHRFGTSYTITADETSDPNLYGSLREKKATIKKSRDETLSSRCQYTVDRCVKTIRSFLLASNDNIFTLCEDVYIGASRRRCHKSLWRNRTSCVAFDVEERVGVLTQ